MIIAVYLKLEKDYRAYAEVDHSTCEGCEVCIKICPYSVPFMNPDALAEIKPDTCKGCGICVPHCKTDSIRMHYTLNVEPYTSPEMDREGLRSRLDKCALEAGLTLRDQTGGKVWVLAEGSPRFKEAVKEALVMGADEGIMLSDPTFLGADHGASSLVLEKALNKIGGCDLLIAPQRTLRGEPLFCLSWVAERMGMAYMPFVRELEANKERILARLACGNSLVEYSISLPAALTVEGDIIEPRGLSLMGTARAMGKEILSWGSEDLGLSEDQVGESGSSVVIERVEAPPRAKKKERKGGEMLKGSPEVLTQTLLERFKAWGVV